MKRLTAVSFGFDDDGEVGESGEYSDKNTAQALFETVCEQKISANDGEEEEDKEDDVWGDKTKEISFGETVLSSTPGKKKEDEDKEMEVDEDGEKLLLSAAIFFLNPSNTTRPSSSRLARGRP